MTKKNPKLFPTRVVHIGNVPIGGDQPIRIQSMTTTSTKDIEKTIDQIMQLSDRGCEIVRMAVQGRKEAESCETIKNSLLQKGYTLPLVADIHFYPPAAFFVTDFVEKIRINPGNFFDKRASFKQVLYTEQEYLQELQKMEEAFLPFLEKLKKQKKALRIGTNLGSLSDRIMSRFGDTPKGMVESALEYANFCRNQDFHDLVFSMKASNPLLMIQAYRLLVKEMIKRGWDYPLHLGVTEAGEGLEGRIKSSLGIGSLLLDGLGDTIRISLTEDPIEEIEPCKRLIAFVEERFGSRESTKIKTAEKETKSGKGTEYSLEKAFQSLLEKAEKIPTKRTILFPQELLTCSGAEEKVFLAVKKEEILSDRFFANLGITEIEIKKPEKTKEEAILKKSSLTPDGLVLEKGFLEKELLNKIDNTKNANENELVKNELLLSKLSKLKTLGFCIVEKTLLQEAKEGDFAVFVKATDDWEKIISIQPKLLFYLAPEKSALFSTRQFFSWMEEKKCRIPVIISVEYSCPKEDFPIWASCEIGALLADRLGEGVMIDSFLPLSFRNLVSFKVIQAANLRKSEAEFISCPGCGRTLFDLQSVAKKIKEKTSHLSGIKIAIMGCIVNGPGEMADSDFGYIGSLPNKVDLYVGKTCVEKGLDSSIAEEKLLELIKKEGKWKDR